MLAGHVSHVGLVIDEKYEIESKLGSGGMATVYRATRRLIGDTVAIKILHPEQVRDPQGAERFRREAQAAARLKHPNAVTIYDFGVAPDGLVYLVMELVEGKNIRTMIREKGPLPPKTVADILTQACGALEAAHRQHIVHRDIKPDNIVVDVTPAGLRVKVLDFGIAWMRDMSTASLTQTGNVIGTPHYMSPEQCLGEELDNRSDIYSLGVVLFEMLAGVVPFNSPTSTAVIIQHVNQAPPPLRVINISVPSAVETVVLRALSKSREDRPQSAQYLAEEFNSAVTGGIGPRGNEAINGANEGTASPAPRDGLAPTQKMSIPSWGGESAPGLAPVYAPASGRKKRQRMQVWVAGATASAIIAAGVMFFRSGSKAGGSTRSSEIELAGATPTAPMKPNDELASGVGRPSGAIPVVPNAPTNQPGSAQRVAGEIARRASYLNVSSLPSKVDFVVSAASSGGVPMSTFASELARSLRNRNKSASSSVFSREFVTSGAFDSFFDGGGATIMRAMPLSSMGNRLLLARVDVGLEATQGTSVEGLVTARVKAAFAILSTRDGSVTEAFELSSVVAGISKDAATSSALDRILEGLAERGY